jgi:hypothetical protein
MQRATEATTAISACVGDLGQLGTRQAAALARRSACPQSYAASQRPWALAQPRSAPPPDMPRHTAPCLQRLTRDPAAVPSRAVRRVATPLRSASTAA